MSITSTALQFVPQVIFDEDTIKDIPINRYPEPFVKWAGGKSQLLSQFEEFFPHEFNKYIEPFVGGGAVFFYLQATKRINKEAILTDNNEELINCYQIVKNEPQLLIKKLIELELEHKSKGEDFYYLVRAWDREKTFKKKSRIERAARTIFLNKTCYNGLYRVNSKGYFNVPCGRYKNPTICDEDNLLLVNKVLQRTKLVLGDFKSCSNYAEKGDFIYFDPPYFPLTETANFTSYTKENFGLEDQKRLRNTVDVLVQKGCYVMISNSNTDFIRNLYKDFNIHEVQAKRYINCDAKNRGKIVELVITNY